ncbi:MAG: phosphodiester glycosidase family protein [Bacteroidales bacterium]|nr:phosphodiester glycosidase family protein [Bacteroidales bacterium]
MRRFTSIIAALALALPVFAQVGDGWTEKIVAPGIKYFSFSGVEPVSGSPQEIFVLDWDMSNPAYALRYTWTDKETITSTVHRRENAVASLNAAYEPISTVVKVGGFYHSCMPRDTVMETPVPNWKSEAAIYTDATGRKVKIAFDGKGKSIEEQRAFYAESPWENIYTSAPMLIDDFEPVGAFFMDSTLTAEQILAYNYEDPVRHQGVRHPRTAVAITGDGHFLMVAVDGRRKGLSEGMSARELTRFLERNFHPQYALNMDGGGSTTLCVRGEGDPVTNVVNYPTGNKKHDHAGERKLFSHFCIVEVPQTPSADEIRAQVRADWNKSSGLDRVLDWGPKASTPAPKGYEATYISHYGRHGSRYAYTAKAYTVLLDMLREGDSAQNLTPFGSDLLAQLEPFWAKAQYRVGDLTELGWQQHAQIAGTMVKSFPKAFAKGSRVDAASSASVRAIMSMTSCVSALSRLAPKADIYAHQGKMDIQATRPNEKNNPFVYKGPETVFPYGETSTQFFQRRFPQYPEVLARLFKDPVKALGERNPYNVFFNMYMFVGGMNSLPEDMKLDVSGIFTPEEYATLWEIDNYERFREYLPYRVPCSSIVDDIVMKADERLASGEKGADLRFGHDHIVMSLLMIMDIDGFSRYPSCPDDLIEVFQTYRSPMATNIQFVFYTSKKGQEPLVKVLHNGEEVRLGFLQPYSGPYYKWSDVREYLEGRVAVFVDKN